MTSTSSAQKRGFEAISDDGAAAGSETAAGASARIPSDLGSWTDWRSREIRLDIYHGTTKDKLNYTDAFWKILQPVWNGRRYAEFTTAFTLALPREEGFPEKGFSYHNVSMITEADSPARDELMGRLDQVHKGHYDLNTAANDDENESAFKEALHSLLEYMIELRTVVSHSTDPLLAPRVHRACVKKIEVLDDTLRKMAEACGCTDVYT